MCGRFYLDDDMSREIKKILAGMEEERRHGHPIPKGEIYPSTPIPVLYWENGASKVELFRWGFPTPYSKSLVINARSETAREKPMFREDIRCRRCLIVANGFYEWDRKKKDKVKYYFTSQDGAPVYMAGLYHMCEDGQHTAILTTAANASMEPVHDRMPVILQGGELQAWLEDSREALRLMEKIPPLLERRPADPKPEYEQLKLDL